MESSKLFIEHMMSVETLVRALGSVELEEN